MSPLHPHHSNSTINVFIYLSFSLYLTTDTTKYNPSSWQVIVTLTSAQLDFDVSCARGTNRFTYTFFLEVAIFGCYYAYFLFVQLNCIFISFLIMLICFDQSCNLLVLVNFQLGQPMVRGLSAPDWVWLSQQVVQVLT